MRRLWITYPVNPMMSASVSKSISSTFSSMSTTSCSRGVIPATVGSDRFGNTHFLLRLGRIRSNVQKDSGFFGAIRQIFIRAPYGAVEAGSFRLAGRAAGDSTGSSAEPKRKP